MTEFSPHGFGSGAEVGKNDDGEKDGDKKGGSGDIPTERVDEKKAEEIAGALDKWLKDEKDNPGGKR